MKHDADRHQLDGGLTINEEGQGVADGVVAADQGFLRCDRQGSPSRSQGLPFEHSRHTSSDAVVVEGPQLARLAGDCEGGVGFAFGFAL